MVLTTRKIIRNIEKLKQDLTLATSNVASSQALGDAIRTTLGANLSLLQVALNTANQLALTRQVNTKTQLTHFANTNTSNIIVSTGAGDTVLYLNLSHWWANSNVTIDVNDKISINTGTGNIINTVVLSLPSSSNQIPLLYPIPGNLVSSNIQIYKASPITTHTVRTSDIGKVVASNSGIIFITDSFHNSGDNFYIHNSNTTANIIITQNSTVTIYRANTSNAGALPTSGSFNLAPKGYITMTCIDANTYVVTGTGII